MDVMLDIETLSHEPGGVILEVAAVEFDTETGGTGREGVVYLPLNESLARGYTVSESTMTWWLNNHPEMLRDIINKGNTSKYDIEQSLTMFTDLLKDRTIWCHAVFDYPILHKYFEDILYNDPMHHKKIMDITTLVNNADFDLKSLDWSRKSHDALDDCKFQIDYVVECLKIIKSNKQ